MDIGGWVAIAGLGLTVLGHLAMASRWQGKTDAEIAALKAGASDVETIRKSVAKVQEDVAFIRGRMEHSR